jgi:hypothetical protein
MAKKKLDMKFVKHAHRRAFYEYLRDKGRDKFTLSHVYWYMYLRSGKGNVFHLADEHAAADMGMDLSRYRATRRVLKADGWMGCNRPDHQGVPDWVLSTEAKRTGAICATPKGTSAKGSNAKAPTAVVVHRQEALDPNAYTFPCETTSPTSSDLSVCHSVNHGADAPELNNQDTDKPSDNLTAEEEAVRDAVGDRSDIPLAFGVGYFHDGHLADLTRIAKALRARNRSEVWLSQLVHWAKVAEAKDREANFWKRRLQTGDKGITKLAEYLETGTIAEQFDAKLYARKPNALEVVRGESNDLLIYDGVWVEKQRLGDAYVAPPEYECACGSHCKGFCKLECEMEVAE